MTDATTPQPSDAAATPPVTPPTPVPPQTDAPVYAPPAPPAGQTYPPTPQPPAYQPPTAAPPYGSAPHYGAPAPQTNVLAIISLIASIVGFIWLLPFIGSLGGAIMGHISLNQIKRTGENGRGMALAGVIVGWAGVAIAVLAIGLIIFFMVLAAAASSRYSTY